MGGSGEGALQGDDHAPRLCLAEAERSDPGVADGFKVDLQAMDWQTVVSRRAKKAWCRSTTFSVTFARTSIVRSAPGR